MKSVLYTARNTLKYRSSLLYSCLLLQRGRNSDISILPQIYRCFSSSGTILPPITVPTTHKLDQSSSIRDKIVHILPSHTKNVSPTRLLKFVQENQEQFHISDVIFFLKSLVELKYRFNEPLLDKFTLLMVEARGKLSPDEVFNIMRSLLHFSNQKSSQIELINASCQKILEFPTKEFGVLQGSRIAEWIQVIQHFQSLRLDTNALVSKFSDHVQQTLSNFENVGGNTRLLDVAPVLRLFFNPYIKWDHQTLNSAIVRELARLTPYYNLTKVQPSHVARFLPHLYKSSNHTTRGSVNVLIEALHPVLVNATTEVRTETILKPAEVTNILISLKYVPWFTSKEHDLIGFLAQEMNLSLSSASSPQQYPLKALCYSLHGLHSQYIDTPNIELLIQAIASHLEVYLTLNQESCQYEMKEPFTPLQSSDLGAALYGLRHMTNTTPSMKYLLNTLRSLLQSCQAQFLSRTIGSCLQGICSMKSDTLEVNAIIDLISARVKENSEPLSSISLSTFLFSLRNKSLHSESVGYLTEVLLDKMQKSDRLIFTPEQVLQMIIGIRYFDNSSPITQRVTAYLTMALQRLSNINSQDINENRFSQLLSLTSCVISSEDHGGPDLIKNWLRYLRYLMEIKRIPEDHSGDNVEENYLRTVPASSFHSRYQLTTAQTIECLESLEGLNSEYMEVRKFIRDLAVLIYKSPQVRLLPVDVAKCHVVLDHLNCGHFEVNFLMEVLEYKRDEKSNMKESVDWHHRHISSDERLHHQLKLHQA